MKEMNSLTHSCMHFFRLLWRSWRFRAVPVFMIRATGAKLRMLASEAVLLFAVCALWRRILGRGKRTSVEKRTTFRRLHAGRFPGTQIRRPECAAAVQTCDSTQRRAEVEQNWGSRSSSRRPMGAIRRRADGSENGAQIKTGWEAVNGK